MGQVYVTRLAILNWPTDSQSKTVETSKHAAPPLGYPVSKWIVSNSEVCEVLLHVRISVTGNGDRISPLCH